MTDAPIRPLTPAEQAVADLLADGLTVPQIALRLGRSYHTIAMQIKMAAQKLPGSTDAQARVRAFALALRAGRGRLSA